MENHINSLKSDITHQTYIQELKHDLSGLEISPSGNHIERFTFAKAATGRLDDITKQIGKINYTTVGGSVTDITKKLDLSGAYKAGSSTTDLAKKIDFSDVTKIGTTTSSGTADLAKKIDFSDVTKIGNSNLGDLSKKFDDIGSSLGKNIDNTAENVDNISKTTANTMKKNLDDITEGTKDVGTKTSKNIDNAGDEVKDLYKQAKQFDLDSAKKFAKDNKFLLVGGVAVGVIAAIALAKFEELDNKPFNITKISTDKDSGYIKLEYSPQQTLHEDDTIEITESNSTPQLLGTHNIYDLIDDSSLFIETTDITLEIEGTNGLFIYKTTYGICSKLSYVILLVMQQILQVKGFFNQHSQVH
jgi:hypothetical protein